MIRLGFSRPHFSDLLGHVCKYHKSPPVAEMFALETSHLLVLQGPRLFLPDWEASTLW